ncbi:MAG: diaminopimelate decarboxylase [Clostridia bacterium]|nr:diaminopimelate decarboxylase [Clostridia bacterium]
MDPKTVSECLGIQTDGHLTIGGCDTVRLAKEYGTPLYVMDETTIRNALRSFRTSMEQHYPNGFSVSFASKACSFKEMYRIVNEEQCTADVVSLGEMYTALQAGFPAEKLYFHGNNKTAYDLETAIGYGVGHYVVDNRSELLRLSRIAAMHQAQVKVLLRITPGIDAHTHDFVKTGQIDSKFGFTLETGEALQAVGEALSLPNLTLCGVHCHIGSQIFDEKPFAHAADVMLRFMAQIRDTYGVTLEELDLGGGFGIRYTDADEPLPYGEYMALVSDTLHKTAKELNYPMPRIVIEPGRSIVASAGITLYEIGHVKHIPGIRTYVNVDGGMADNPRYALYRADYTVIVANKADMAPTETVTIAGRCCESGDLIQEHTSLQPCEEGDILAVLATGAYNYSMASHYNRLPNPPVVMIRNGKARLVVKGESYKDLCRNDI